jgi:ABC-2 type transport system permease protein
VADHPPVGWTSADPATLDRGGALRAYVHLTRGQVRSQAAYRVSFLVDVLGAATGTIFDVLTVLVLFRATRTLGGFGLAEAMVMVGLSAAGFAVADTVVGNVDRLQFYVRTGLLDAVLVRPLGALPQLVLGDLALRKISRAMIGVGVLIAALVAADVEWTPARAALVLLAPVAATVFFGSLFVLGGCVAFWWTDSGQVSHAFTYGGRDLTSYPITVYGAAFRRVFAYGLGYAFVAYYPALALLGRADPLGLPSWVGWLSPAVALVAAGTAAAAWRAGIRHYRSTGS